MKSVTEIEILKDQLVRGTKSEQLEALKAVNAENALELYEEIAALTYHFRVEVRVAALNALRFVEQSYLTTIIRENIRDENREVRLAASTLFHMIENIAA